MIHLARLAVGLAIMAAAVLTAGTIDHWFFYFVYALVIAGVLGLAYWIGCTVVNGAP